MYTIIVSFLILVVSIACSSQGLYVQNYTTSDGLPSSEFYDVHIDSNGFVWFTSDRGVVRYNSYEFETFSIEDGLANMVNFTFYKESENTFWINGIDGSLTFWNGVRFMPFAFNGCLKEYLKDEFNWFEIIGTDESKIYCLSGNTRSMIQYVIDRSTGEIVERGDYPLICSDKCSRLTKRKVNYFKYWEERGSPKNDYVLYKDRYCYTLGAPFRIDERITSFAIRNELVLDNKKLLLMTEGGLIICDQLGRGAISYLIEGASITSAVKTSSDEYWATSRSNGIFRLPSISIKNIDFKAMENNIDGMYLADTLLYCKSQLGQVFAINKGNRVKRISTLNKPGFYRGYADPINKNLFYFGGFQYKNGEPYDRVGGDYGNYIPIDGFRSIEYNYREIVYFTQKEGRKDTLFQLPERLMSIAIDSLKDVYLGTHKGVYKLNYSNSKTLFSSRYYESTCEMRINDMECSGDIVWAGTIGNGLIYKINDDWSRFDNSYLSSKSVNAIFSQNDSTLWVGTNRGLNKVVFAITNKKIVIKSVDYYNTSNGLISNYIKDILFFNGNLYVASDKGITYFQPEKIVYPAPHIHIDQIIVNNEIVEPNDSIIVLSHHQNDVRIRYTGLTNFRPLGSDFFYEYQLCNGLETNCIDSKWVATNNRELEFLNLKPGMYSFHVKCKNLNRISSETKSTLFRIKQHYSETLLFRVVLTLMLAIFVGILIWIRAKALKKQLSLELRVKGAELDTLRNQINPHFIFNSINTLQQFIFSDKKIEANQYVCSLSNMIRKSLAFSRIENVSLNEEIEFIREYLLLEKLRFKEKFEFEIVQNFPDNMDEIFVPPLLTQPMVENAIKHAFKDISYVGVLKIVYGLGKEAVEVKIMDNGVGFKVNERKSNHDKTSLGIQIVRERIELLNERFRFSTSKLSIVSVPGEGTQVIIYLPIFRDET